MFTGPTDKAAVHFVSLGVTPPSDNVAVADMVLDLVIKAPRSQVTAKKTQIIALRGGAGLLVSAA